MKKSKIKVSCVWPRKKRVWARYLGNKFVYADSSEPPTLRTHPSSPFAVNIKGETLFWDKAVEVEIRPLAIEKRGSRR